MSINQPLEKHPTMFKDECLSDTPRPKELTARDLLLEPDLVGRNFLLRDKSKSMIGKIIAIEEEDGTILVTTDQCYFRQIKKGDSGVDGDNSWKNGPILWKERIPIDQEGVHLYTGELRFDISEDKYYAFLPQDLDLEKQMGSV